MRESGWPWLFGKAYALLQRNPSSNRVVVDVAELSGDEEVLDVGCGAGRAMALAARIVGEEKVTGVDPTRALAETARRRVPKSRVEIAVAEDLPFGDASFDVVWTIAAHHHWEDSPAGLGEVGRVLRPGGRFLLAEYRNRRDGGHGLSERESEDLAQRLGEMGFEDVAIIRRRSGWRTLIVLSARRRRPM